MYAKIAYMFGEVPSLWVAVPLYFVASFLIIGYLWTRNDCWSCSVRTALLRSALLALIITPSVISDFYVCDLIAPASLGFVAMISLLPFVRHDMLLPAVLYSLLYYVLPLLIATLLIFGVWLGALRRRLAKA